MITIQMRGTYRLDSAYVKSRVRTGTRKAMMRFGGYVRKTAQRSMRYATPRRMQEKEVAAGKRKRVRGYRPSKPGKPPRAVLPFAPIRRLLEYAYTPAGGGSVVIGAKLGRRPTGVPALHEHGGHKRIKNPRRRKRKIGGGGEIRLGRRPKSKTTKRIAGRGGKWVTYGKLRTASQVARANQINRLLYGPDEIDANYPERPFMEPAMRTEVARSLHKCFRNCLHAKGR